MSDILDTGRTEVENKMAVMFKLICYYGFAVNINVHSEF